MRSHKLLALLFCLITGPALAGYMTLLGAGLGAIQPVAQSNFIQSSYSANLADLNAVATFSRAGNAMQFDSSGYLTYGPNNLLTYSNTFSNAAWSKTSVTVSSGVDDPVGGTAAWTLTATGANGFIQQNYTAIGPAINWFWVRRRTGTGNVLLCDAGGTGRTMTVTGSWTQVYYKAPATGTGFFYIQLATSGDAIDVYAAGGSLVGAETTPRTQDQVITTSAAHYGPRFTAALGSGTVLGVLEEEARTNIVLWNRDLTNAAWVKTNATAAKTQTGIDNVANSASVITATAGNGTVLQSVTLASSQRMQTAYVKRVTGSGVINMTTDGGATWTAITVTAAYTRVRIPAQTVTNPQFGFQIVTNGDAIAVDYVQNETGASETTPIYTQAAAVARPAETIQAAGAALTALQGANWTAFVETAALPGVVAGSTALLGLNASQTVLYVGNATQVATYNGSSGLTATVGSSGNFTTGAVRAGIASSSSGRSLVANGGTVSTDANSAAPTAVTSAYLGSINGGAFPVNGPIASFAVYNSRLPDAMLQAKSVVGAAY